MTEKLERFSMECFYGDSEWNEYQQTNASDYLDYLLIVERSKTDYLIPENYEPIHCEENS